METSKPQNVPDRYSVTEIKPGLWAIWDREKRCYWESSRVRHEMDDLVRAYNADQRGEVPSLPYGS